MGELVKQIHEVLTENWRANFSHAADLSKTPKIIVEAKKEFPLLPQGRPIEYHTCLRIQAARRDWFHKWFSSNGER